MKQLIGTEPVFKFCGVNEEVTIQFDASEIGLGATLLKQEQPVAYTSRALSQTKQRYALMRKSYENCVLM